MKKKRQFSPSDVNYLREKKDKTLEEWQYLHDIGICYHEIYQCEVCKASGKREE